MLLYFAKKYYLSTYLLPTNLEIYFFTIFIIEFELNHQFKNIIKYIFYAANMCITVFNFLRRILIV